jgi:hypothetical protein
MASYSIIHQNGAYTTIAVEFGEQVFEQTVLLNKPADLQAYADAYEADFAALAIQAVPVEEVAQPKRKAKAKAVSAPVEETE